MLAVIHRCKEFVAFGVEFNAGLAEVGLFEPRNDSFFPRLELEPVLCVGLEFAWVHFGEDLEDLIEQDEPAVFLFELELRSVNLLVVAEDVLVVVSSYLDVLKVLFESQQHLRADVIQEGSLSFQDFD